MTYWSIPENYVVLSGISLLLVAWCGNATYVLSESLFSATNYTPYTQLWLSVRVLTYIKHSFGDVFCVVIWLLSNVRYTFELNVLCPLQVSTILTKCRFNAGSSAPALANINSNMGILSPTQIYNHTANNPYIILLNILQHCCINYYQILNIKLTHSFIECISGRLKYTLQTLCTCNLNWYSTAHN